MIEAVNRCDYLAEMLSTEEITAKDFFVRILQHLRLFFNSEFMYQRNLAQKALNSYQKLQKSLIETQTHFPDLYANWQYDIDRILLRIDARIQEVKAIIASEEKDSVQADILYVETINRYTNELQLEQSQGDYDHYFNSLMNIYQTTGQLYRLRGRNSSSQTDLYQAMKNFKKAKFLGQLNIESVLSEIHEEIISLTLAKLENQAEMTFNNGLMESEAERFDKAVPYYHKSAQIYRLLRQIRSNIEYELQENIQLSSYYEATAKYLMGLDDNEQASRQFANAAQTLTRVLENLPGDTLKLNFQPQIDYFNSMQLFCQAVTEYDQLVPEAMDHFKEAKEKIQTAKAKANTINNVPLFKSCEDALNKLESYLEIAELMFQPKDYEFKENEE